MNVPAGDILEWDVRTWGRALPFWQSHLPGRRPLRALALGERGGGVSLWLAVQGIDVLCTDLRPFPNTTAALHRRYGVDGRVSYGREDAAALSGHDNTFDLVAFKSVLGALGSRDKQKQALLEIHRVLCPGGKLLFAENLVGVELHQWLRRRYAPWARYWRYLDCLKDRDLFGPFAGFDARTTGFLSLLGRNEHQRGLLAMLDGLLLSIVPSTWRTVWFGVAQK